MLKRVVDENDKRRIRVYITEDGKKFCIHKHREIINKVTTLLEHLGEEDAKEYIRIMKKISNIVKTITDEVK